jgi:hypothetical protein
MNCGGRFNFVADMNGNGVYTVSDVWFQLKWLFFAPGDAVICFMGNTRLGEFFEISYWSFGNAFSAFVSGVVWPFAILFAYVTVVASLGRTPF